MFDYDTTDKILRKAVELADEHPDFVYSAPGTSPVCLYVHDRGTPEQTGGCLFGQAMLAVGVAPESIPERPIEGMLNQTHPAATQASRVQVRQDWHSPWGEAIKPLRAALAGGE